MPSVVLAVGNPTTQLVQPVHVRRGDFEVRTFSTLTSIGSPLDVRVQELTIEMFFPAVEAPEQAFQRLANA